MDDAAKALLRDIRERGERVWELRGNVGGLLAVRDARDDVPRLLAALDGVLNAAADWQRYCAEGDAQDECAREIRKIVTRELTGAEAVPREVPRVDGLDLTGVGMLPPEGVAELEQRITRYWQQLTANRLRAADLSGFDLNAVWSDLDFLGIAGSDLAFVDWREVGRKLDGSAAGLAEVRRLHALLGAPETHVEAPGA